MYKTEISRRTFKAGYVLVKGVVDGVDFGCPDYEMTHAETPSGDYIGDSKTAHFLCKKRGIQPEKASPKHGVCSIGFCDAEQKWFGWSHRAIYGFGIGDVVKDGDCCAESGWTEDYLADHPEEDRRLPVGFTAKTLDDAKRMAVAFAESVG